jgi:hypothetical protein
VYSTHKIKRSRCTAKVCTFSTSLIITYFGSLERTSKYPFVEKRYENLIPQGLQVSNITRHDMTLIYPFHVAHHLTCRDGCTSTVLHNRRLLIRLEASSAGFACCHYGWPWSHLLVGCCTRLLSSLPSDGWLTT